LEGVKPPVPQPSLRAVFSHYGVDSAVDAIAAQEIETFYVDSLGILVVGSPTGPTTRTAQGAFQQSYTFGSIIKPAGVFPDVADRVHVTVTLAGVRCFGTDDPGGTDEPFLITSAYATDPTIEEKYRRVQTVRIGPDGVGDVVVGNVFGESRNLVTDMAVPGDADIALNVQLFDEEEVTNPEKIREAVDTANKAAIAATVGALTVINPAIGAAAAAVALLLEATGINAWVADGIETLITDAFGDDHLGTVDLRITRAFLEALRDNPRGMDRTSDAIGGETYNFPQLPEDDSAAGKSWMFREEGRGTYRPFFRVVLTEP